MSWLHVHVDPLARDRVLEEILAEFHGANDSTGFEVFVSGSLDHGPLALYLSDVAARRVAGVLRRPGALVERLPSTCRLLIGRRARPRLQLVT